jgi:hypothetical protein
MPQGIPGTFRGDKPLLEHPETRAVALQASSSISITESADQSSSEVPSITAEPSSRLSACLTLSSSKPKLRVLFFFLIHLMAFFLSVLRS